MSGSLNFNRVLLLLVLGMFMISSCNTVEPEVKTPPKTNTLPVPQQEFFQQLATVDYIDYLFDDLSFSVSVSNIESVRGNLGYLTTLEVPNIRCAAPLGTVYYQAKGAHVAQARSYFGNGCAYFIFTDKNNRPLTAVMMSEAGKTFFNQIVNQTKSTPQPPAAQPPVTPSEGN